MATTTSKALATTKGSTAKPAARTAPKEVTAAIVITEIPTVQEVKEAVRSQSKLYFDGEGAGGSILADALERMESPADVFAGSGLLKVKEHLGETFTVTAIESVNNSEFDEDAGLGIYLVVSAVDVQGEVVKLAVGAADPVARLIALHHMGAFPWAIAFEQSAKKTRAGYYPINLVSRQPKAGQKAF